MNTRTKTSRFSVTNILAAGIGTLAVACALLYAYRMLLHRADAAPKQEVPVLGGIVASSTDDIAVPLEDRSRKKGIEVSSSSIDPLVSLVPLPADASSSVSATEEGASAPITASSSVTIPPSGSAADDGAEEPYCS